MVKVDCYRVFLAKFKMGISFNSTLANENDMLVASVSSVQDETGLKLNAKFYDINGRVLEQLDEIYTVKECTEKEDILNYRFQKTVCEKVRKQYSVAFYLLHSPI